MRSIRPAVTQKAIKRRRLGSRKRKGTISSMPNIIPQEIW